MEEWSHHNPEMLSGRQTLVNIDLLLPPILPGLLLSALCREIRSIHVCVVAKMNQASALQVFCFFFLHHLFPGDRSASYLASLSPFVVLVCWTKTASVCFLMLSVRHHLYSVCSGVSICAYSCTGLQPVALIMPCVSLASGVSPYQQDFQGFPSASWRYTSVFPPLSHSDRHALKSLSQMHINSCSPFIPMQAQRKWVWKKTFDSGGSHCAVFPWRPQRIRSWVKTDHGWKSNLILFLRLCFVKVIVSLCAHCWFITEERNKVWRLTFVK